MENPLTARTGLDETTVRHHNSLSVRLFSLYLNLMPDAITPDMISELSDTAGITRSEAYAQYLCALAGLDAGGRDRVFFRYWLQPAVRELDPAPYLADEYLTRIGGVAGKSGRFELKEEELRPLEAFVFRDFIVTPDRRMIPQIGFFKQPYRFPAILENGREWMTLQPNEITTAAPAVAAARGRVLTYGLGLGYFAFCATQKPEVTSVTVVERSQEAIALFRRFLLPRFAHPQKLTLICADAFDYAARQMRSEHFDFVFTDIWHDAGDGKALYLRMKPFEKENPGTVFSYWLEDTIRCYLDPTLW